MSTLAVIVGIFLIITALWDTFETVVLPRRVTRRFRIARLFYRITWPLWSGACSLVPARRRESMLSYYGPLSLLLLHDNQSWLGALTAILDASSFVIACLEGVRTSGAAHVRHDPAYAGRSRTRTLRRSETPSDRPSSC